MKQTGINWLLFGAGALTLVISGFFWLTRTASALDPSTAPRQSAATPSPIPTPAQPVGPYPGELAPDFRLAGLDLQEVRLSDHRGHKVLLNFFTTWCEPCRLEMPGVQSQYEEHAEHGWVVIGVDMMEPLPDVEAFRDEFGLTFPVALDLGGNVSREYEIRGTPTNITIDEDGVVVDRRLGYMSEDQIEEMLQAVP